MQTEAAEECGGSEPPRHRLPPAVACAPPTPRLESHQKNAVEEEIPQCVMTLHFRLVLRNKKSGVGGGGGGLVIVGSL